MTTQNDLPILLDVTDGVGRITLNRPKAYNALNKDLAVQLLDALIRCDEDDNVRALVITGNGPSFCAGGDIRQMMEAVAKVGDAAFHAADVHAEMLKLGPFVRADLEQFPAMKEGQLVMVLAAAVDDDPLGLWEGAHRVFDAGHEGQRAKGVVFGRPRPSVVPGAEEHDFPAAARGVRMDAPRHPEHSREVQGIER